MSEFIAGTDATVEELKAWPEKYLNFFTHPHLAWQMNADEVEKANQVVQQKIVDFVRAELANAVR